MTVNVGTKTQAIGAQGHVGIDMVTPVSVWVCVWVSVCVGLCGSVLVCAGVRACLCVCVRRGGLSKVAWPLVGSLGALLGLSEALLGLSWRAKPFCCRPFTLHFLWSCAFPWAGMGLAHFAQLAELSKGCNGLGWAGLSKVLGWNGLGSLRAAG